MASKEEEGDDFETNPSESPGEMLRKMLETVMELRQQRTEEINSLVEKMQQEIETVMRDQSSVNTEDIQALHSKLNMVASFLKTDASEMKTRRRIPPSRLCRMKSSSCNDVAATEFSTLELRIDALEKHVEMLPHTQEQSSTLDFQHMADSLAKLEKTVAQLSKSQSESEKKLRLRLNALEVKAQQKKVVEDQKYSVLKDENTKLKAKVINTEKKLNGKIESLQQEIDELKSKLETEKPSESVKTSDFELWKTTLESEMSQMKAEIQGQKDKSLREELEKQRAELENLRKTFKKGKKALTDKIKDVSVLEKIFNNRLAKKSKQVEEKLMELIKLQREKFKPKLDEIEHDVQVLWEAQDKLESREKNFVEEIEEMKYVQTDDEPLLLSSEVGKLILGQEVLMLQLGDMGEKLEVLQQDSDFRKHAWNKLIVDKDDTISKTELIAAVRQLGFKFEMMKEIIVNRVDRLEILRRNLAQLDKSVTKRQEIGDQVTHLQNVVKSLQLLIHDKDNTRTSHGTSKDMAATCASNFQFSWPRLDSTTFSGNVKQGSLGRPTSKSLLTSGVTAHPNVTSSSSVTDFRSSVTSSSSIVTSSAISFASISSTSLFGNKKTGNSTLAEEPFSGFSFGRPSMVMTTTTTSAVKPLATVTSLALTAVASTASGSGALKTAVSSGFVTLTTTSSSSIVTSSAVSCASISSSSLFSNKKTENSTLAKAPVSGFSFGLSSKMMTTTTALDKQISVTGLALTAVASTTSRISALTTAATSGSGAITSAATSRFDALTTTTLSGFGALTSAATSGFDALTTTSSSGFGALTAAATLSGFGALTTTTSPSPIVTVSFAPNGSASFFCDKKSQISTFSKTPLTGLSFSVPSNVMTSTTASDKQISAVKPLATGKDSARTTVASTALGSSSPIPALGSGALTTASTSGSGALTTASTSGSSALTTASTSGSGALTTASTSGSGALTTVSTSGSGALKTVTTSGSGALTTATTLGSGALTTATTLGSGALTTASTSGSGALTTATTLGSSALKTATTSGSGALTSLSSNTINTLTTLEEHGSRRRLEKKNRARSRSKSRSFANLTFPRNFGFDAHNEFFHFPLAEEVASDFDLPETVSYDQNKIVHFFMAGKKSKPDANFSRFTPPSGQDTILKKGLNVPIETSHICITAMKMYEYKSLEELRWEEYQQDPKLLRKTFKFWPSQK